LGGWRLFKIAKWGRKELTGSSTVWFVRDFGEEKKYKKKKEADQTWRFCGGTRYKEFTKMKGGTRPKATLEGLRARSNSGLQGKKLTETKENKVLRLG